MNKFNKISSTVFAISSSCLFMLISTSCSKNTESKIKGEQIGMCLSSYFDAYSREPEASEKLNTAKEKLLQTFNTVNTDGKYYALGNLGGANNSARYHDFSFDGLFSAIARQPNHATSVIQAEEKAIQYITETNSDCKAEMIGLGSASLCDSIARQPEIAEDLLNYSTYICDSIIRVSSDDNACSIGYSSTGFYDSCARQPEQKDSMWEQYKTYLDALK